MNVFLGFDVGATKTAWGKFSETGELVTSGRFATPNNPDHFIAQVGEVVTAQTPAAVGIGIAGTISKDHHSTLLCTNLPHLSHLDVATRLKEVRDIPYVLDNDARCALIGEVLKGAAQDMSSAVLITIGTGIGGAQMRQGVVQPHPSDIGKEISRIVADPSDVFPARSGPGTIEALIGGRNLEQRLQVDLGKLSQDARANDPEALATWQLISEYFLLAIRAIHITYSCKNIIVGGKGVKELDLYLQTEPPCPVVPAKLGEQAALYGAAQLAMDAYEAETSEWE